MPSTNVTEELAESVAQAKRKISDAVLQLMTELPPGIRLDSVVVHLMPTDILGGGKSTVLSGVFISLEL